MVLMQGVILEGVGGFYYVENAEGDCYECRARGKFRLDQVTPLAGDRVQFEKTDHAMTGYLQTIEPRKNELLRPLVANIDIFILVLSASVPKPDFKLCDKLLIQAQRSKVKAAIILNKCDEADEIIVKEVRETYEHFVCAFIETSAKNGQGLEVVRELIQNKISCFSGQSAVGKSSLINSLCDTMQLETGRLSKKTARGRHTTRTTTLLKLNGIEGYVIDTPGFSLLDLNDLPAEEIQSYYPEIEQFGADCRFQNCLHRQEPECAVKNAVEKGLIHAGRYQRYLEIMEEQMNKEKKRYR